jgi:hypothetical protein
VQQVRALKVRWIPASNSGNGISWYVGRSATRVADPVHDYKSALAGSHGVCDDRRVLAAAAAAMQGVAKRTGND